jgi:DNA helicase-2/ATP-dependent DNA helicase PcrA
VADVDVLLSELDEDQRQAVTHGEGPLLVVAGAGSGKTRVLTYRIAYLLAAGKARPHEVLAVTFTNKAAREMVERVEALLGGPLRGGFVGTFHRFALQLLRRHPREAGLPPRFAICDADDQRRLLDEVLKEKGITSGQLQPRVARARVSAAKNALVTPDALAQSARMPLEEAVAAVYAAYQERLRAAGAVDFDDMLLLSAAVLEREEALRKGLRERFRWILVDEYQDTNLAQARLVRLLGGPRPNLTAVGDEDQSIYRWRGAEVENILRFEEAYPGARVVTLGRNYRSAEPILSAAAGLIAHNARRRAKRLSSQAGGGTPVVLYLAADEADEARFVADELVRRSETGSAAVLFRINAQSRSFEAELVRRGVSYVVVGGTRFWERAEIKDALAYLRLVAAPDDELAFRRAVRVPARGIGAVAMDHLAAAASRWKVSLPEAARRVPEELPPRARMALGAFFAVLSAVAAEDAPGEAMRVLLERSGLADQYTLEDEEDRNRRANLDQLVAATAEAGERGLDLEEFLDEVALVSDADTQAKGPSVVLSTLHAAKGLEFDTVFLVGLDEGLLPLRRGDEDPEDLEEERRLAYVGMTRARRRLFLVAARMRRLHGQMLPGRPSPFLLEVPRDVVEDRSSQAGRDAFRTHFAAPGAPSGGGWTREGRHPVSGSAAVRPPAAGRAPSPRPAKGERGGWRPGAKVRHATFGTGVILQVQGSGAQIRVVVYFDRAGRKTLVPSIAKLERL